MTGDFKIARYLFSYRVFWKKSTQKQKIKMDIYS